MAQIFPKWTNDTPRIAAVGTAVLGAFVVFAFYWWASPKNTDVGYKPKQPVEYSHALHAGKADGQLGMDCRYCHAYVERGAHASIPPTHTCMNCHKQVKTDSPKLQLVRDSYASDKSIEWVKIHKLPDYAYFDHSAHVGFGVGENRGAIGCETCHGRIDQMEVVKQVQPLSMGWCLECHSDPAQNIRPVSAVTYMGWIPDAEWRVKAEAIAKTINPPGSLSRAKQIDANGQPITVASAGCNGCHH
jgi:hypothetical protein